MDHGTYISCIKIGRLPIIPPLLSEECRNEMRYYRDVAISLEKRRKCRRNSADSGVIISSNDRICRTLANTSETVASEPLPTSDTSKDLVSVDGSSGNEVVISAENSSGDSDHDNVFFEVENSPSLQERRNSYTIERNADNETREVASGLPNLNPQASHVTASNSATIESMRRNSYTLIDAENTAIQNSESPAPRQCRNSYTVDTCSAATQNLGVPMVRERRNSYTLENPSPVMLQYMQSLQQHDPNKHCELFVESIKNYDVADVAAAENQLKNDITQKEISLEDLVSDDAEYDDLKLSESGLWDACSDETLHNFLTSNLQSTKSFTSSICGSPVSVVQACSSSKCLKNSVEKTCKDTQPSAAVINLSCECICNAISNFEPLRSPVADVISLTKDRVDDSFSRDFRCLDLSSFSYDDSDMCAEGRYSECSSVSLNKFLSGDKLPEGTEAEYAAFVYMKEQLELKHRNEFKRLLREQQKEHDNLKAQFHKISSLSKRTPSPKSNYAYSGSVVLKKYTPLSGCSTPLRSKSVDERQLNGICKPNGFSDVVEIKRKILTKNGEPPRLPLTVARAASKINAAVRGYLTRRLFKTEKVTLLVQTIKDCLTTAVSLQSEENLGLSELDLQSRLLQQLTVACNDLHSTFLLPLPERMAIIAADREKKFRLSLKKKTPLPLSEATRRTLQRKILANSAPPAQRQYDRRRCKSASSTASATSCRSTPGSRRRLASTIMSQKFSVSVGGRRPWR